MVCWLAQIGCARAAGPQVTKAQALKNVKVSSVVNWQEALSEKGRFRILFPGQPEDSSEAGTVMKGFKFTEPAANWFAYYNDFDELKSNDEQDLRGAYQGSVEAITRKAGTRLLKQEDVFLNGRLGTEFVIERAGSISYMRAFLFGRRMYTLAVDRKTAATGDSAVPVEVKQFFESFTYWD